MIHYFVQNFSSLFGVTRNLKITFNFLYFFYILRHTENIYYLFYFLDLFLLLYLLTMQEILCMICFFLNLFYEVYNPLAQHFQIQNRFLLTLFAPLFDYYLKKRFRKVFNNIICFTTLNNVFVITHMNSASFSCISRRNKIYTHREWIFHTLDIFSAVLSRKYGIIM